jgi:hypothetical protein
LARTWGRESFGEQSTLSRTLDAFGEEQIAQLRQGSEVLFRRESRTLRHDFDHDWLWLEGATADPGKMHTRQKSDKILPDRLEESQGENDEPADTM